MPRKTAGAPVAKLPEPAIKNLKVETLAPTGHVGDALQRAFDHFNAKLFDSRLPPCIILLHRKKNANGYFWPERFGKRGDGELKLHEIALNPSTMGGRTDRDVLSTLVNAWAKPGANLVCGDCEETLEEQD